MVERGRDEESVVADFGHRFGRPATLVCSRAMGGAASSCSYRWFAVGGVILDLVTRGERSPDGRRGVRVTATAEATNLARKAQRTVAVSGVALGSDD